MELVSLRVIFFALIGGVLPTLVWLWFWLREDSVKPEPFGLLVLTFLSGALAVIITLPLQEFVYEFVFTSAFALTLVLAGIEEALKFITTALISFKTNFLDEPIDYAVYLVTGGLGFAAAENTLYLIDPLLSNNIALTVITSNLRFLGATVLHAVVGAIIGISMGLAYYKSTSVRLIHTFFGIILATTLHTLFNFFIIQESEYRILITFGVLWVTVIFIVLLFERLKRLLPVPMRQKIYATKTIIT